MRECRVQKGISELHWTLESAVNFGPGEEFPHLGSEAAHRRATSITGTSWKLCVRDKWVKQESRTLDPECRDSAGRAQKGYNGSRRPYIRPQSAGSWINRLRGLKPSRSVKIQSVNRVNYKGATGLVVESSAVGRIQGARSPRRDV